jgi:integrase
MQIEQAAPKRTAYELWDDSLRGFGIRIYPSGQRSFLVLYRLKGSRRLIRKMLGRYGVVTLTEARTKAREMLAQRALSNDPQAPEKARKVEDLRQSKILTVQKLANQYLAALHRGAASDNVGQLLTARYIGDTVRHIACFTAGHAELEADTVTRANVLLLLDSYAHSPAKRKQLHGAIRRMYTWAQQRELVRTNPAILIKTTPPDPRTRALSLDELARVWHATTVMSPLYRDVTRMLMVTGQRRNEVGRMQWGEIDLAKALWTLPAKRTKARREHVVPLAPLAMEILHRRRSLFRNRPPAADDWVFPSLSRDHQRIVPIGGWDRAKGLIKREVTIDPWSLHDFRRSLVTICAERGVDIAVLDTLLNHAAAATRGGVLGIYQRATLVEPMRAVMTLWNGLLCEAIGIEPAAVDSRVAPLRT